MKTITLCLAAACLLSTTANAALESRLDGQAVYDTDLHITWLANADTNGMMNWSQANEWAAGLSLGGFSGWRLPATIQPDALCFSQVSAIYGFNCRGSEMGHLFYDELGLTFISAATPPNSSYALFQNIRSDRYWSSTEYDTNNAWYFRFDNGYQAATIKDATFYALAVHDGDVAAVPIPAAAWLLGSGLMGLIGVARRKAA